MCFGILTIYSQIVPTIKTKINWLKTKTKYESVQLEMLQGHVEASHHFQSEIEPHYTTVRNLPISYPSTKWKTKVMTIIDFYNHNMVLICFPKSFLRTTCEYISPDNNIIMILSCSKVSGVNNSPIITMRGHDVITVPAYTEQCLGESCVVFGSCW